MFSPDGIQNANSMISKTAAIRRIDCSGLTVSPQIECLFIASTTAVLSHARRTNPPRHDSCQRRKAWSTANISFQSMCFERCLDGVASEKTCLLYIPPIPLISLASVAISWVSRLSCIMEIADQDSRNLRHQRRSSLAARGIRILRNRCRSLHRHNREKSCRKNGRPNGTT